MFSALQQYSTSFVVLGGLLVIVGLVLSYFNGRAQSQDRDSSSTNGRRAGPDVDKFDRARKQSDESTQGHSTAGGSAISSTLPPLGVGDTAVNVSTMSDQRVSGVGSIPTVTIPHVQTNNSNSVHIGEGNRVGAEVRQPNTFPPPPNKIDYKSFVTSHDAGTHSEPETQNQSPNVSQPDGLRESVDALNRAAPFDIVQPREAATNGIARNTDQSPALESRPLQPSGTTIATIRALNLGEDALSKLEKLAELYAAGEITKNDYEAMKKLVFAGQL